MAWSSTPDWFQEGLAEFETRQGWGNVFNRIIVRGFLWWNGDRIMNVDTFLTYVPGDSGAQVDIFYTSSFEFTRYMVDRFGIEALWDILYNMRGGRTFNDAFHDVTGTNPSQLYLEWQRVF
jgi:hypothetical protein